MPNSAERYKSVLEEVQDCAKNMEDPRGDVTLIAVSKTFSVEEIKPVIEAGCRVFGENRVQEAQSKWPQLRLEYSDLSLHLIGPLQSNKTSEAVALFDVIQTVDREKIAKALVKEMKIQGRMPQLFVQVNTGSEPQKAGVNPDEALAFVNWCQNDLGLSIEGLMAIPPFDENPGPHFALLQNLARKAGLSSLSMGMSGDYLTAVEFGASHVRVGSAIFGPR